MYSGLTIFSKHSGVFLGTHQKIDRLSRRQLNRVAPGSEHFPTIKQILQFEGLNGPDGIKRKSPGHNEPWHYVDPFDANDTQLNDILIDHHKKLVAALKKADMIRAGFEAAWLAHALVDGLTPAHHYPYEQELSKLRGGEGRESRTTFRKKLIMTGETRRERVSNNWKMWGAGGLYTSHASFEMGVATLIKPLRFSEALPKDTDLANARDIGLVELFNRAAREVAVMDMYKNYCQKGWTPKLASQVRHRLGPILVQTVTLAWYITLIDAGITDTQT